MPELPEVETIKRQLRDLVVGRTIQDARVMDPRLVRFPSVPEFERGLRGQRIDAVDRRAKYLLIRLSSGRILAVHLVLTGQLLLLEPGIPMQRSARMVLDLDDGQQIRLVDASHLARVYLVSEQEMEGQLHLSELGPDALSDELTPQRFKALLRGSGRAIKALLLDQKVIAGLGNIYTDEVLHAAGIHPLRRAGSLTSDEAERLYRAIRAILRDAVELRGTTIRSYRDLLGRKGGYQDLLKVVGRAGKPCFGCGGTVERMQVAGRETYYCPACQREEAAA